ncbi:MAG: hypothetical protein ACK46C_19325 [Flavobacteriales bacterium]
MSNENKTPPVTPSWPPAKAVDTFIRLVLLGRGAAVPMPVIFLGSIGGFLLSGFIGLFTGAVVLSIGYRLMNSWMTGFKAADNG